MFSILLLSSVEFLRVTKVEVLRLTNFDPHSVKANPEAIKEYDRLRKSYIIDLRIIIITKTRWSKLGDSIWRVEKYFD